MHEGAAIGSGPICSVIVVNWHSVGDLRKCLSSLHTQGEGSGLEIIIVDNASYDGVSQYCRELGSRVRFIQSHRNLGFAAANNLGASVATGRLLLFLNPDTEARPHAISRLLSVMESDLRIGVVGARLLNTDGTIQTSAVLPRPTVLGALLDARVIERRLPGLVPAGARVSRNEDAASRTVQAVSGACMLVRRSVFEAIRGFSEDYFMYAEDIDLCCKVRKIGGRVVHAPVAEVVHHGGGATKSNGRNAFPVVLQRQSDWLCVRKFHGALYAFAYRAAVAASACIRLCLIALSSVALWPVNSLLPRNLIFKWRSVLSWALGGQIWCRDTTAMRK